MRESDRYLTAVTWRQVWLLASKTHGTFFHTDKRKGIRGWTRGHRKRKKGTVEPFGCGRGLFQETQESSYWLSCVIQDLVRVSSAVNATTICPTGPILAAISAGWPSEDVRFNFIKPRCCCFHFPSDVEEIFHIKQDVSESSTAPLEQVDGRF